MQTECNVYAQRPQARGLRAYISDRILSVGEEKLNKLLLEKIQLITGHCLHKTLLTTK